MDVNSPSPPPGVLSYSSYIEGDPGYLFSRVRLNSFTVADSIETDLPTILPKGSVTFVQFSPEIPDPAVHHCPLKIEGRLFMPHMDDILHLSAGQRKAYYGNGARSVTLNIKGK